MVGHFQRHRYIPPVGLAADHRTQNTARVTQFLSHIDQSKFGYLDPVAANLELIIVHLKGERAPAALLELRFTSPVLIEVGQGCGKVGERSLSCAFSHLIDPRWFFSVELLFELKGGGL